MPWTQLEHSKSRVDAAGQKLRDADLALFEFFEPDLHVLSNWRSSHSFPLNSIQMNLRQATTRVCSGAIIAQRLKRTPSIVHKLRRFSNMRLSQMQDVGGCRAVLDSVAQVAELREHYRAGSGGHTFVYETNYIERPDETGYRSHHLIYRYGSVRSPAFDGLHQVEIQLRSTLQHAWATAVETADIFGEGSLKFGTGDPDWQRFFALSGSAFAMLESTPLVPSTPATPAELERELAQLWSQLDVGTHLAAYGDAVQTIEDRSVAGADYYLLVLSPRDGSLEIHGYSQRRQREATAQYFQSEKESEATEGTQVVLVSADSISTLRASYPNYFMDTQVFLEAVGEFLKS